MNINFTNRESDQAFCKVIDESKTVQQWLLNRISGYNNIGMKVTLEICIDPYYRGTEKVFKDFSWAIYSQIVDNYGRIEGEIQPIINGGLIYRGDSEYSSHT